MRRAERLAGAAPARLGNGFTLAELLVALTLLAILATVLFGALTAHVRLARLLAERVLETDAIRTASTVLSGELRRTDPRDVRAVAHDSVALRAFRGAGVGCGTEGDDVVVHYRGDRDPDPAKDSVLWIRAGGPPAAVALRAVQPVTRAGCTGVAAGEVQLWRMDPVPPGRGVLLLFEAGTYFLAGSALRYRIGAGGRQPITAERFIHPATGFASPAPAVVEYRLAVPGAARAPTIGSIHFRLP